MKRIEVALLLVLVALSGAVLAQPVDSLLLHVRIEAEGGANGFFVPFQVEELQVYRDGLVVGSIRFEDGSLLLYRSRQTEVARARLLDTLSRNRVGRVRGQCGYFFGTVGVVRSLRITWYGLPPRQHTFEVGAFFGIPCDAEELAIANEIDFLRIAALGDIAGQRHPVFGGGHPFCEQD